MKTNSGIQTGMVNNCSAKGQFDIYNFNRTLYKNINIKLSLVYLVKPQFSHTTLTLVQRVQFKLTPLYIIRTCVWRSGFAGSEKTRQHSLNPCPLSFTARNLIAIYMSIVVVHSLFVCTNDIQSGNELMSMPMCRPWHNSHNVHDTGTSIQATDEKHARLSRHALVCLVYPVKTFLECHENFLINKILCSNENTISYINWISSSACCCLGMTRLNDFEGFVRPADRMPLTLLYIKEFQNRSSAWFLWSSICPFLGDEVYLGFARETFIYTKRSCCTSLAPFHPPSIPEYLFALCPPQPLPTSTTLTAYSRIGQLCEIKIWRTSQCLI